MWSVSHSGLCRLVLTHVALPAVRFSCPRRAPAVRVCPCRTSLSLFGPPYRSPVALFVRAGALRVAPPTLSFRPGGLSFELSPLSAGPRVDFALRVCHLFVQHPARVGARSCRPPPGFPVPNLYSFGRSASAVRPCCPCVSPDPPVKCLVVSGRSTGTLGGDVVRRRSGRPLSCGAPGSQGVTPPKPVMPTI